jgi:hypothetical protein
MVEPMLVVRVRVSFPDVRMGVVIAKDAASIGAFDARVICVRDGTNQLSPSVPSDCQNLCDIDEESALTPNSPFDDEPVRSLKTERQVIVEDEPLASKVVHTAGMNQEISVEGAPSVRVAEISPPRHFVATRNP